MFNKEDKKWYNLAKFNPDKYDISIDNGEIFVCEKDEVVHTFSEYGHHFIFQMMDYEGFSCDAV